MATPTPFGCPRFEDEGEALPALDPESAAMSDAAADLALQLAAKAGRGEEAVADLARLKRALAGSACVALVMSKLGCSRTKAVTFVFAANPHWFSPTSHLRTPNRLRTNRGHRVLHSHGPCGYRRNVGADHA